MSQAQPTAEMVLEEIRKEPGITYSALKSRLKHDDKDRAIDRALQKLRRKGQATYSRKDGWVAATA